MPRNALLAVALATSVLSPADRPIAAGRVVSGAAAAFPSAPAAALPRFALFGWVSPPRESTTAARYAELAGAGFNVTGLAWADSGLASENQLRLDYTRPHGVRNLLFDQQLENIRFPDTSTYHWADSVAARYRGDSAFLGYYLGDEPPASQFTELGNYFALLAARDPSHPSWNNLNGRLTFATLAEWLTYTRDYVAAVHPAVLCNDQYDFLDSGDRHQLVENVAGLAAVARENGVPFWGIVLLTKHGSYRQVTTGMLRWQIAQWLSYGARGIGYFTYWTPAPDVNLDWQPAMIEWGTGNRTAMYDTVKTLNARLRPLGEYLAGLQWLATEHAGSVPIGGTTFAGDSLLAAVEGRAAIGEFADSAGTPHLFVANDDSLGARTITLTLGGRGRRAWRLRDDGGAWDELSVSGSNRLSLPLEAGDFALLRLSGACDSLVAGACTLRLSLGPNPARGAVRFSLSGASGATTLEILDLSGRRVWSRSFPGGSAGVAWSGERTGGGRAHAGVYFVRLEDARGVLVRRLSWLGAP